MFVEKRELEREKQKTKGLRFSDRRGGSALPLGSGGFFSPGFTGFCLREAGVYLAPSSPAIIRVLRSLRSMISLAYLYSASQSLSGAACCYVGNRGLIEGGVVPVMNPPPTESRRVAVSEAGGRRLTFVGTRGGLNDVWSYTWVGKSVLF
ncbi:hypothetical protein Rs2_01968 [Raphanus sativus]|nr:hypothetical protein Rs2_01968 [Raphanus sativus]